MDFAYDAQGNRTRLSRLGERGVKVWGPERVYVGEDVSLARILPGAELVNASITGASTYIGSQSQIGVSGLARIHESQIGAGAVLGAGSYENCVLLARAKARGFAEFRAGTVLEEEAETGHNVGLKHTLFAAGVVAGSSINFCDIVVCGGSSRSDHSEVGSGAVHFNFDPRGDKFGSLLGDATGCLLRSRRIFIGGNCGLVAPLHIDFGAVVPAGSTIRKDVGENQLAVGSPPGDGRDSGSGGDLDYDFERYFDLSRKFAATARLIGNLYALRAWYQRVRHPFAEAEGRVLYAAADLEFERHAKYRCQQLVKVVDKLERSISKPCKTEKDRAFHAQHKKLLESRDAILSFLLRETDSMPPAQFLVEYEQRRRDRDHLDAVRALSDASVGLCADWLRAIADEPRRRMRGLFQSD